MMSKRPWNGDSPQCMQVFCAALSGFIANDAFNGSHYQGSALAAIAFADEVVLEAFYRDEEPSVSSNNRTSE